jgi:hypothetical protein
MIRDWGNDERVFLRAFDLIEFKGDDLRKEPLIVLVTTRPARPRCGKSRRVVTSAASGRLPGALR